MTRAQSRILHALPINATLTARQIADAIHKPASDAQRHTVYVQLNTPLGMGCVTVDRGFPAFWSITTTGISALSEQHRPSFVDRMGTNPEKIHVDDGRYLPSRRGTKRVAT
jgi:hypothetical protein